MRNSHGKSEYYGHFFPILDAIKIPRKKLKEFVKETSNDVSANVYISDASFYCKKCKKTIPKFSPVIAFFLGAGVLSAVFCWECGSPKLDYDGKKSRKQHYEL